VNFPNIERRDSGPASQDRTSDAWFGPELTDDQVEAQDSLFGVELLPREAVTAARRTYEIARRMGVRLP